MSAFELPGSGGGGGLEVAYAEITTSVQTSGGAETEVVTSPSYTYEGSVPYVVEFFSPNVANFADGESFRLLLREDPAGANTELGILAQISSSNIQMPVHVARRLSPSAGAHTYRVTVVRFAGSGEPFIGAGAGGTTTLLPAFIRITRA